MLGPSGAPSPFLAASPPARAGPRAGPLPLRQAPPDSGGDKLFEEPGRGRAGEEVGGAPGPLDWGSRRHASGHPPRPAPPPPAGLRLLPPGSASSRRAPTLPRPPGPALPRLLPPGPGPPPPTGLRFLPPGSAPPSGLRLLPPAAARPLPLGPASSLRAAWPRRPPLPPGWWFLFPVTRRLPTSGPGKRWRGRGLCFEELVEEGGRQSEGGAGAAKLAKVPVVSRPLKLGSGEFRRVAFQ